MPLTYHQFLKHFSTLNDWIKVRIVTANFFMKLMLLVVLFWLKLIFVVVAFPYYLFVRPRTALVTPSGKRLETVTASPPRFQQVLVLSLSATAVLLFSLQALLAPLVEKDIEIHGVTYLPLVLSDSRAYQPTVPSIIKDVSVSSVDQVVAFTGTGPAYAKIALFVDNGQSYVGTSRVGASGQWTLIQPAGYGTLNPGEHSSFAAFYGDDNVVIGNPTPAKTFTVPFDTFSMFFHAFGFNTLFLLVLGLGVLIFSVVKLRKASTA